jgi:hypothetical protein
MHAHAAMHGPTIPRVPPVRLRVCCRIAASAVLAHCLSVRRHRGTRSSTLLRSLGLRRGRVRPPPAVAGPSTAAVRIPPPSPAPHPPLPIPPAPPPCPPSSPCPPPLPLLRGSLIPPPSLFPATTSVLPPGCRLPHRFPIPFPLPRPGLAHRHLLVPPPLRSPPGPIPDLDPSLLFDSQAPHHIKVARLPASCQSFNQGTCRSREVKAGMLCFSGASRRGFDHRQTRRTKRAFFGDLK